MGKNNKPKKEPVKVNEDKIEYGLIFKVDWTDILGLFQGHKRGDLKIIAFGTSEATNYSDWYLLFLGVGIGIRAKGTYGKELKIDPNTRVLIFMGYGCFILLMLLIIAMRYLL